MQIMIFYYFSLALLGAIMGSFIGALTWRMKRGLNWLSGRSECEHCHHRLAPTDMIPIISYLGLGGRCRYCHKRIGRLALRLEVLTCLSFVLSGVFFPSVLEHAWRDPSITLGIACTPTGIWCRSPGLAWLAFGLWLACLVLMVALFVYDLRWRKLPNRLVFPLIGLSLVYSLVTLPLLHGGGAGGWLMAVAGGMMPIAGIYGAIYLASRGKLVGLGDVKLGLAIGLLVPQWWLGLVILFLANFLATLVSLPALLRHRLKRTSSIPFGPYLIVATYLAFLLSWLIQPTLQSFFTL